MKLRGRGPSFQRLRQFMLRWRPMVSRVSASSSDYSSRAMVIRNCSRVELPVSRLASCRSWDCSRRLAGRTLSALTEFVGGIMLAFGFLTRFVAAALVIEFCGDRLRDQMGERFLRFCAKGDPARFCRHDPRGFRVRVVLGFDLPCASVHRRWTLVRRSRYRPRTLAAFKSFCRVPDQLFRRFRHQADLPRPSTGTADIEQGAFGKAQSMNIALTTFLCRLMA